MRERRTDLALEAHDFFAGEGNFPLSGVKIKKARSRGGTVTSVDVESEEAGRLLGKVRGRYVTLELPEHTQHEAEVFRRAAELLARELRRLLRRCGGGKNVLVVGLGNTAMTPDAIGPAAAEQVLVTRHLKGEAAFADFSSVSVLLPGVLGKTGVETAELVRGAARTVLPDAVLAIDALASARLSRVCSTVQLADTGIVPGSGVGNHRNALNEETLGVPVIAVGVPTVVDAATLSIDVLEEAGVTDFDASMLKSCAPGVMVTPRDIDAQIECIARLLGCGINLALQPQLDFEALAALVG